MGPGFEIPFGPMVGAGVAAGAVAGGGIGYFFGHHHGVIRGASCRSTAQSSYIGSTVAGSAWVVWLLLVLALSVCCFTKNVETSRMEILLNKIVRKTITRWHTKNLKNAQKLKMHTSKFVPAAKSVSCNFKFARSAKQRQENFPFASNSLCLAPSLVQNLRL